MLQDDYSDVKQHLRSAEVQNKLAAGTHQLSQVATLSTFNNDIENPISTPVLDENGKPIVTNFSLWKVRKKDRPQCGARCRNGDLCKARVQVRQDGSFMKRCRMHGGSSPLATGQYPLKARVDAMEELCAELEVFIGRAEARAEAKGESRANQDVVAFFQRMYAEFRAQIALLTEAMEATGQKSSRRIDEVEAGEGDTLTPEGMLELRKQLGI